MGFRGRSVRGLREISCVSRGRRSVETANQPMGGGQSTGQALLAAERTNFQTTIAGPSVVEVMVEINLVRFSDPPATSSALTRKRDETDNHYEWR